MMRACILGLLGLVTSTLAIDLSGFVQWNEHCRDYASLGRARVILDDGFASGSVTRDGRWSIPDVEPGTYILSVLAHNHKFDQLRIDVLAHTPSEPIVRPLPPGSPLNPASPVILPYPIKLSARQSNSYYIPPESFNILSMVGNPMTLMMLAGGVMMFAVPYITKNMDPEMQAEMQANQAKLTNIQSSFMSGDVAGSLNALMSGGEQQPTEKSASTSATQHSSSKKTTKKRR
ncbi:hypothetical protein PENSPDRAFT_748460 [Peniophora sp. CONT]|nr:hypothetical protein PENSPDRAFT_748460 [Peniophora sp. CONT]